jgi:hypothetical protein
MKDENSYNVLESLILKITNGKVINFPKAEVTLAVAA